MPAAKNPNRKVIHKTDLADETGLSIRACESLEREGLFPARVRLSTRRVGWLADEVAAWREARRQDRDAGRTTGTQFQGNIAQPMK
jgi:predicted DNA-binding transcriptional regulator AlpA